MNEPAKKTIKSTESYSPKNKPEILNMAAESQIKQGLNEEPFVRKNTVELMNLDEKIKVVGLDFYKCKQTGSVELNSPFDLYAGDKIKLQSNIRNLKRPQNGYAVMKRGEIFIFGKEVTDFDEQDELYGSFSIPTGQYVKVSWNAETFSELVMEAMEKAWERSGADAFLADRNLVRDGLYIEVYPHESMCVGCENGPEWSPNVENAYEVPITRYPQMYTLHSVKEKE